MNFNRQEPRCDIGLRVIGAADCEVWTRHDNVQYLNAMRRAEAYDAEDCKTMCIDTDQCTGVDWVTAEDPFVIQGCWLVGPWCSGTDQRPGFTYYALDDDCYSGMLPYIS